jgi:hypothetical protein
MGEQAKNYKVERDFLFEKVLLAEHLFVQWLAWQNCFYPLKFLRCNRLFFGLIAHEFFELL